MSTLELANQYLHWASTVERKRPLTIRSYGDTLRAFAASHVSPTDATTDSIELFILRQRRGGRAPAPATSKRDRDALRSFYRWLVSRGHVESDPTADVGVPTVRNKDPHPVPDHVWVPLWRSAMPREDRVWLGLGYYAGLRRFELATIPPDLFDVESQAIRAFERKGGSTFAVEYGQMAGVVADHLPHLAENWERWLDDVAWLATFRRGEQFMAPSSKGVSVLNDTGWFNKRIKALLRAADLDEGAVTPHGLRHSCATNLLRCGAPIEIIADQLSHSSIETTRRYLQTSGQLGRWRLQAREGA
jgi:site-specific recombinase XerD